jgi:hypothetical protein
LLYRTDTVLTDGEAPVVILADDAPTRWDDTVGIRLGVPVGRYYLDRSRSNIGLIELTGQKPDDDAEVIVTRTGLLFIAEKRDSGLSRDEEVPGLTLRLGPYPGLEHHAAGKGAAGTAIRFVASQKPV